MDFNTSQAYMVAVDQVSKTVSGLISMAAEVSPQAILINTGVLGVVVLGLAWGFKTNFLALGREVRREREYNAEKEKIIQHQRHIIGMFIQQSGRTLPVMAETAQHVVSKQEDEQAQVLGMLAELKEAIIHNGPSS